MAHKTLNAYPDAWMKRRPRTDAGVRATLRVLALLEGLPIALFEVCLQRLIVGRQSLGLCPRPRDFLRHGSGVRVVAKSGPGPRERPRARCTLGAPSAWLSLVRLRPRRA